MCLLRCERSRYAAFEAKDLPSYVRRDRERTPIAATNLDGRGMELRFVLATSSSAASPDDESHEQTDSPNSSIVVDIVKLRRSVCRRLTGIESPCTTTRGQMSQRAMLFPVWRLSREPREPAFPVRTTPFLLFVRLSEVVFIRCHPPDLSHSRGATDEVRLQCRLSRSARGTISSTRRNLSNKPNSFVPGSASSLPGHSTEFGNMVAKDRNRDTLLEPASKYPPLRFVYSLSSVWVHPAPKWTPRQTLFISSIVSRLLETTASVEQVLHTMSADRKEPTTTKTGNVTGHHLRADCLNV